MHCYASSLFLALFILLSVFIGLLYYMWINRLWCHILTFNCVTFMFKFCTAIYLVISTNLYSSWHEEQDWMWRESLYCKLGWICWLEPITLDGLQLGCRNRKMQGTVVLAKSSLNIRDWVNKKKSRKVAFTVDKKQGSKKEI